MKGVLAVLAVLIAAGAYYFFYYPPTLLKRATQDALQQFADSVATKDRAKISDTLTRFLTAEAKVRLEIHILSITQPNLPPMVQDFPSKESFIQFIDNTLYPLSDYSYSAKLRQFTLAEDRQSAAVKFTSKEWGDGINYFGGASVQMRFSSDTDCEGKVIFAGEVAQLDQVVCKMEFRSVPKPGEANKFRDMDAIQDLLKQQR